MTLFFRGLADVPIGDDAAPEDAGSRPCHAAFYDAQGLAGPHRTRVLALAARLRLRVRTEGQTDDVRRAAHAAAPTRSTSCAITSPSRPSTRRLPATRR